MFKPVVLLISSLLILVTLYNACGKNEIPKEVLALAKDSSKESQSSKSMSSTQNNFQQENTTNNEIGVTQKQKSKTLIDVTPSSGSKSASVDNTKKCESCNGSELDTDRGFEIRDDPFGLNLSGYYKNLQDFEEKILESFPLAGTCVNLIKNGTLEQDYKCKCTFVKPGQGPCVGYVYFQ